jgi:ABC-type lipoprotein export system ATPase subunit
MLLKLEKISKNYRANDQVDPLLVLKSIDFTLAKNESCVIYGPSGSGKSTLLNIIGGLTRPDSGIVEFNGNDLNQLSNDELAYYRNRDIGFIFQQHHLLPQLTLIDNILLPTVPFAQDKQESELLSRAMEMLKRVGLTNRQSHRPGQLSMGECQRVAMIRALINKPRLLLADEPTGALDSANANNLIDLLLELNVVERTALIVVTHSQLVTDKFSNKYRLRNGVIKLV